MRCPKCGSELSPFSLECKSCREKENPSRKVPILEEHPSHKKEEVEPATKKKKNTYKLLAEFGQSEEIEEPEGKKKRNVGKIAAQEHLAQSHSQESLQSR